MGHAQMTDSQIMECKATEITEISMKKKSILLLKRIDLIDDSSTDELEKHM